jgi:photosystem II stability/assembly factor-like uncharacterized protein
MKFMKKALLLFILVTLQFKIVNAQWEECNGPYSCFTRAYAAIGNYEFAGTHSSSLPGGVYRTSDWGSSGWYQMNNGLTNIQVSSLATNGTDLFAGTEGGVFLSSDNAISWTKINNGISDTAITALALSGSTIFAATDHGKVYISTNNGSLWTSVSTGLPNNSIHSIATNGTIVCVGTEDGRIYISTNNGASWQQVDQGLFSDAISALLIDGTTIIAASWEVYRSTDNCQTWNKVLNDGFNGITKYGSTLFGVGYNGAFVSYNNGLNWSQQNYGLLLWNCHSVGVNPPYVFASLDGGGAYRRLLSDFSSIESQPLSGTKVSVLDNPCKGIITVVFNDIHGDASASIYNTSGQLIKIQNISQTNTRIDVSDLCKGIYILKVSDEQTNYVNKIIKE